MAFAIISGLIPSFEMAGIADDIPSGAAVMTVDGDDEDDANPGVAPELESADRGVPAASGGAAASNASMPGTAFDIAAKSSGLRNDFAMTKNTPAAPAACSGVEPSSLANPWASSGFALAAADSASVCDGVPKSVCALAAAVDESHTTIADTAMHEIR